MFKDKNILLIGGTGTIGQGLIRKIIKYSPNQIRIFSRDEYKQFELQNEISEHEKLQFLIGDVRDFSQLVNAMDNIDYVFHLAALKHVSSCEYNPFEAIQTNIIGTNNVIRAAVSQKIKKVIFTSSDKAIYPVNNYGATKLIGEKLISATTKNYQENGTIFASVRFGNVIGSRGSVIPLFVKQIINHNMITLTDENMSRFMLTLSDAVDLTIKAMEISVGGEIFILKMPVINLKDLVSVVIEETCKKYNLNPQNVKIKKIGLRPGEKMYEELMTLDESTKALENHDMFIIPSPYTTQQFNFHFKKARIGTYSSDKETPISIEEIRKIILNENLINR